MKLILAVFVLSTVLAGCTHNKTPDVKYTTDIDQNVEMDNSNDGINSDVDMLEEEVVKLEDAPDFPTLDDNDLGLE